MSELDPRPETPASWAPPSPPPPPRPEAPTSGTPLSDSPNPHPPSPYGYPPPYPYRYPVQPPFNTYAILATVFAFAVFAPLGIYFGYKARQQIAQTGERGSELATVGIIGGWIISCLQGAFLLVWCGLFLTFLAGAP